MKQVRAIVCVAAFFLTAGVVHAVEMTHEQAVRVSMAGSVGAPDPNTSQWRLIDDFFYLTGGKSPLDHDWAIFSGQGQGSVGVVYDDVLGDTVYVATTSIGLGFKVQCPKSILLNSRKRYVTLKARSDSLFAVIFLVKVDSAGAQINKHLMYIADDGSPAVSGDTLKFYLGSSYRNGQWQIILFQLEDDLRTVYSTYWLVFIDRVFLCGSLKDAAWAVWNRNAIEGYDNLTSVKQGDPIAFHVSYGRASISGSYNIEIYRAGASLELETTLYNIPGQYRTVPDSAFKYGVGWPRDTILTIPTDWKSGAYIAKLIPSSFPPGVSYIPFVVREDAPGSTSNILFQTSVTTYQAYNVWGGISYYDFYDSVISFDRPYVQLREERNGGYPGAGELFAQEEPFIKWLEQMGYTVEYCTNIDLANNQPGFLYSDFLGKYKFFMSIGHDEYWSEIGRNKVELQFRDSRFPNVKNIAFFSGNTCQWRVRFEQDPTNFRKMTCVKANNLYGFDMWQYLTPVNRPESQMMGTWYAPTQVDNTCGGPDTVRISDHWVFHSTGLDSGEAFGFGGGVGLGITGYEVQSKFGLSYPDDTPPEVPLDSIIVLASAAPVIQGDCVSGKRLLSQATIYTLPSSKSQVFSSGCVQWSWGLSDTIGDSGTSRVTKNIIDGLASTFRGHITTNLTWTGNIYLGGDVTVDPGDTLTINRGTRIYFFANNDVERTGGNTNKTELVVNGTLICVGSRTDSIIFTSASTSPNKGDWGGIFIGPTGRADIAFARFSYADTALVMRSDTGTVKVRNSTFTHFKSRAVYSTSTKADLGTSSPPTDCGRNNILLAPGAVGVQKAGTGTMSAVGNWWTSDPPPSNWIQGSVAALAYFSYMANPDSACPGSGGGGGGGCEGDQPCAKITVVDGSRPLKFELGQNYPNPFNAATVILFALPQPSRVELRIYNILGQAVRTFIDEKPVGWYEALWDGRDENGIPVSSGIYLYQIRAGEFVQTKKMQLVK